MKRSRKLSHRKLGFESLERRINLTAFSVVGSTLTVSGTAGNDQFSLTGGATSFIANLNGSSQSFDPATVTHVIYNANGGSDTSTILNLQGTATATFGAAQTSVAGAGYLYQINGSQTVYVFGAAGDTATMNDTAGNDLFYGVPAYSILQNASGNLTTYYNEAIGFGTVDAVATSGTDLAYLYDSSGNDTYTADNTGSQIAGTGFDVHAAGFDVAYGFLLFGGNDTANLAPSASNVDYVYGTSTSTANLSDSTGNDLFYGVPQFGYSLLIAGSSVNEVIGFGDVLATSSAGSDTAILYDTSGDDIFTSGGNMSFMIGGGVTNAAIGFATNYAFFTFGGTNNANLYGGTVRNNYLYGGAHDTANFYDSAGADAFYGLANYGLMDYHGGYASQAIGFGEVNASGTLGDGAEAELVDSTGATITIFGHSGSLVTANTNVEVQNFDAVFEVDE